MRAKKILFTFAICWAQICAPTHAAQAFSTAARSAFLVDYDSGVVLFEKNADVLMPPSSMLKLMTLSLVFDALKSGELKLTDTLTVGKNADYNDPRWYPASKLCLVAGQVVSVNDTIMGLIVQSAGDAAVVAAEKLGGTESEFAKLMMQKARKIGMPKSMFANASGLTDPNNLMTARELAQLGTYIISEYPEFYPLFSTRRFEFTGHQTDWCREWGRTHTLNYNKLLNIMPGADGMKTGHTAEGGYGMVASSRVGGRRIVGVLNGLAAKNHDGLAAEMKRLLNFGYTSTSNKVFYNPGDKIVQIPVWYGRTALVNATVAKPFVATLAADADLNLRVVARFDEPVAAPIAIGAEIGEIIAYNNGREIARAPLVAAERVKKIQFIARIIKNISVMFGGKN